MWAGRQGGGGGRAPREDPPAASRLSVSFRGRKEGGVGGGGVAYRVQNNRWPRSDSSVLFDCLKMSCIALK